MKKSVLGIKISDNLKKDLEKRAKKDSEKTNRKKQKIYDEVLELKRMIVTRKLSIAS